MLSPTCSLEDNRKPRLVWKQAASAHQQAWHRLARNNVNPRNWRGKKWGAVTQELESYGRISPEHKRHSAQGKGKRRNRDVSSFSGACCSSGEILKGSGEVREGINQGIFPGVVSGGRR